MSSPGWVVAVLLLALSAATPSTCQFCPGVATNASSPAAQDPVSLCGGTSTTCGYQCCLGDFCYHCGCNGQQTSDELAVSDLLCSAGSTAKNITDFCSLADLTAPNRNLPNTATCTNELLQVYFALCKSVVTGSLGLSDTYIGKTGIRFEPGECLRVSPDAEYCPKQFPRPACCTGDGSCTTTADGHSRLCATFLDFACCPNYQTYKDTDFYPSPALPLPEAPPAIPASASPSTPGAPGPAPPSTATAAPVATGGRAFRLCLGRASTNFTAVTLCDGSVATCGYSCCYGDYCYHCACTGGSLTPSEIAAQDGLCLAAAGSATPQDFCYNGRYNLENTYVPATRQCQSSANGVLAFMCANTDAKTTRKVTPGGAEYSPGNQVLQAPSPSEAAPPNPSEVNYSPGRCVTLPASQQYCPIAYPQIGCCAPDGSCTAVPNGRLCLLGEAIACCPAIPTATARALAPAGPGQAPAPLTATSPMASPGSSGYYCIGLEAAQQLVTLCDGTTTTCAYQCCYGDFCYFCSCAGRLTSSETAVQLQFCEAAQGARNLTQFCNASDISHFTAADSARKIPFSNTCQLKAAGVFTNMCNARTLAGLSRAYLPEAVISHNPGDCVLVTDATPYCPKSYPVPACCNPIAGGCAGQVNGRSFFCLPTAQLGCCPPYSELYSNFSSPAPLLPIPAASAPTGALPLTGGFSAPVPAPSSAASTFFCPGRAYKADITVTNCDGSVTICKTRCCVGDACFYCQCSGKVTSSEQAAIDGLCIPAQTARTALEFCTGVHDQLLGPNSPSTKACSDSAFSRYIGVCFPTLYDNIATPASYAFRALYPPDNAGTPAAPAMPNATVSFKTSDCILMPYDMEYCPEALPDIGCCHSGSGCDVAVDQSSTVRCNATSTIACCPATGGSPSRMTPSQAPSAVLTTSAPQASPRTAAPSTIATGPSPDASRLSTGPSLPSPSATSMGNTDTGSVVLDFGASSPPAGTSSTIGSSSTSVGSTVLNFGLTQSPGSPKTGSGSG